MTAPDRMFCEPGAECMHHDPYDVWDQWWDQADDDTEPRLVVEEWTVRPNTDHLPGGNAVLDLIAYDCEDNETDADWHDSMLDAMKDPKIKWMAEALVVAIAHRIPYHMAGDLVSTHVVEMVDGVLLYDGEPMTNKASDA